LVLRFFGSSDFPLNVDVETSPVLILGGGINGAAVARELVLNGVPVWLVDTADLAFGATAYSSRLIHGGLRYLEFGEFSLVKESLDERARLLKLAPHLVKPLRLFIPVRNSWGGFVQSAGRFLGLPTKPKKSVHRGLRVVQVGLWLYDRYSRVARPGRAWDARALPPRSLHRPDEAGVPAVNPDVARRLWAYSDAQITFPERLVIDLLADAREIAKAKGLDFRVLTYHQATLRGVAVEIMPVGHGSHPAPTFPQVGRGSPDPAPTGTQVGRGSPDPARPSTEGLPALPPGHGASIEIQPAAIINATGAWVDSTLARLPLPSRRLMGGTKGSHFLTFHPRLAELLKGQGVYTEARDGRPVFLLPFCGGTLVGTTDIPFEGDPANAIATEQELEYLLAVVADIFPDAGLTRADITMHQCGVRPLPYVDAKTPAAITRRHQLVWNEDAPLPLVSLVGGKLTTCRSLAEEAAAAVLTRLGRSVLTTSRDRPIPLSPADTLSSRHTPCAVSSDSLELPPEIISSIIQNEWVTHLEDLVERRLILHFTPHLSQTTLTQLAQALVLHGKLNATDVDQSINRCAARLKSHFGVQIK
jgi:glycerol-3-phosphate dehydrogenase